MLRKKRMMDAVREQFCDELQLEIKMCIDAGDTPILLGDFNAKHTTRRPYIKKWGFVS